MGKVYWVFPITPKLNWLEHCVIISDNLSHGKERNKMRREEFLSKEEKNGER